MKYFLQRDGRTYGPYSFDDLKRYQAENRIGPADQVRREDSQQWEPWQQVLNPPAAQAPVESPMPPVQPGYGGYTPPAQPQQSAFGQPQQPAFGQPQQPAFGQPQQPGFGSNPPAYGGGGFGQPPAEQGFGGGGFGQPQQPQAPQGSETPGGFGGFGGQGGGFGGQSVQPGGFGGSQFGQQPAQPGGFGGAQFGQGPGQPGGFGGGTVGPMPPDMQWWLVAIIGIVCGLFGLFWLWKEVMFVKKIDPATQAPKFYGMGLMLFIGGYIVTFLGTFLGAAMESALVMSILPMLGMLVVLGGAVCLILGSFKMRESIHNYYTMVEPMGINLMDTTGAILTFFFPIYFFQYHFFNIAERKKAMGHPAA